MMYFGRRVIFCYMKEAYICVSGTVQGVFFRATAQERADALGLTGWAENKSDGTVELLVQGSEDLVKAFIQWAKDGPPAAEVEKVTIKWGQVTSRCADFNIRY